MRKLLEFFQDNNGYYSSTRLFMLLTCFTFIFAWIYSIIYYGKYEPSIELLLFVATVLGVKAIEGIKK